MAYLPILTYHRLLDKDPSQAADPKRISVSQKQFRSHLSWLKRLGYQTLRLDRYIDMLNRGEKVPGRSFAITFDDGYEEVLTLALPVLKEFGFTATVFAVPGSSANAWDDGSAKLLTISQLRELDAEGITIGGHTCSHVHLPVVSPHIAQKEIADSRVRLKQILGHEVSLFAYPYGESTPEVEKWTQDAGYTAAFATDRAPQDHGENFFKLRRAVVFPRNGPWEIFLKAQSWYPRYQDWKRR